MRTPAEGRPGGRSCVLSVLNVCWSCAPGAAPGPENRRHTFGIISKPSRIQRPKSGSAKRSAAPRRGLTGQRIPFAMSAERAGDGRRRSQPEGVQRVRGRELALAHRHGLKKVHLPARERGEPVGPRAAQCGAQELFGFEQVVLLDDLGRDEGEVSHEEGDRGGVSLVDLREAPGEPGRNGLPLGGKARDEVPRPFLPADGRGRRADDGALKRSVLIEERLTPKVSEEGPTDGLLSAQDRCHRVQNRTMVVFARIQAAGERLDPVDADHHPGAALVRQSLGKIEDGLPKGGELSSGPREAVGAEQDPEVVRTAVPEPDVGRPGAQPAAQRIGALRFREHAHDGRGEGVEKRLLVEAGGKVEGDDEGRGLLPERLRQHELERRLAEAVGREDRGRPAGLHPAGELLKVGISSDEFGRVVWTR